LRESRFVGRFFRFEHDPFPKTGAHFSGIMLDTKMPGATAGH
jgi:hypothetical protein